MKNGGCDSSQFSSDDGVCNAHTIWFNKAGGRGSLVVCACPRQVSLMNLCMPTPSSQAFVWQVWAGSCWIGNTLLWLRVSVSVIKRKFLKLLETSFNFWVAAIENWVVPDFFVLPQECHRPGPLSRWDSVFSTQSYCVLPNSNYLHTPVVARE